MLTSNVNFINMALVVQKVIKRYQGVWSEHEGFSKQVNKLSGLMDIVQLHQKKAEQQTEGVTLDKANASDYAIKMGLELAGAASIYAKEVKNETLKEQFHILKRDVYNVQGGVALSRLKDLYDNLEAIIDKLGDNVTSAELASFEIAIQDFEGRLVNPRNVIIDREKSNRIIADTIKDMRSTFEDMDNLMSKFKKTEFEREYKPARIVIAYGKGGPGKGKREAPKNDVPEDAAE